MRDQPVPARRRAAVITAPRYTHRPPRARAAEAFERLRPRPAGCVKARVIP